MKMNVDITRLKNELEEYTLIDLEYQFSKEELENTEIIELKQVHIYGNITKNLDNFHLDINVKGEMVLPCSISLKPVKYPFDIKIDEDFEESIQESLKNATNTIDIFSIIWENIVMEIPIRVVSSDLSDVKTEGDGWRLITNKEEKPNPELEKLKNLL